MYQRHNNADIERRSSVSSDGVDTMRRLDKTEGMQRQERMSSVEEEETEHTNKNKAGLYIFYTKIVKSPPPSEFFFM